MSSSGCFASRLFLASSMLLFMPVKYDPSLPSMSSTFASRFFSCIFLHNWQLAIIFPCIVFVCIFTWLGSPQPSTCPSFCFLVPNAFPELPVLRLIFETSLCIFCDRSTDKLAILIKELDNLRQCVYFLHLFDFIQLTTIVSPALFQEAPYVFFIL